MSIKIALIFPVVTIGFLIACQQEKTTSLPATNQSTASLEWKEERNKQIVLARVHGFEKGSVDSVIRAESTAKDFVDYREGGAPKKGIESARSSLQQWMSAFPDYKGENFIVAAEGDYVMVYGEWSGTWKNDFLGMKATGKSFKVNDMAILKLTPEGKVVEHHAILPFATIAKQIGMQLPEQP